MASSLLSLIIHETNEIKESSSLMINTVELIVFSNLSIFNVPDAGYSRNVPDECYSRNVPDEGYSRNVPDEGYS